MNQLLEKFFRGLRWSLVEIDRGLKIIVRRLGEAQDLVTESVKGSLPTAAQRKFAVAQRVAAKMVDLLIVGSLGVLLSSVLGPIGSIAGFVYSMVGDGFSKWGFQGQSIGKKLMGLRVVRAKDQRPIRIRDSVVRNLPVGVATFFAIIPLWGWIICILVGGVLMLIEIGLMLKLDHETRLGDIMADTRVITTS